MEGFRKYLEDKKKKDLSVMEKIGEFPYFDLEKGDVGWKIEILKIKYEVKFYLT